MPIIEQVNPAVPLAQGDLLKDVPLYISQIDPSTGAFSPPAKTKADAALLLSRACALTNKTSFIAAAVFRLPDGPPKTDTGNFEDIKTWLETLRDGEARPDRFYLGQIDALGPGRYMAHFDALHTVSVGKAVVGTNTHLLQLRVGRLSFESARALQVHLFNAFSREGFEDFAWFSTPDLQWLVSAGEQDILAKNTVERAQLVSGGATPSQLTKLDTTVKQLQNSLKPYQDELARRFTPSAPQG